MEELTSEITNLSINIEQGDEPSILSTLNTITKRLAEDPDKKSYVECLLKTGIVGKLTTLLQSKDKLSSACVILATEIVAEISKIDIGRKECNDVDLLSAVLDLLPYKEIPLLLQACRALANICYDNDSARSLVKEKKGVEKLIQLLRDLLEEDEFPENLRTVTSGCLLNLTDTYGEIQEQAIQAGILDVLLQYLKKFDSDNDVVIHCLLVLSCLADSESGREKLMDSAVLSFLLNILEKPMNDDVIDSLLELFGNLCENDFAKLQLAKLGLCDKLVNLVKKRLETGSVTNDENVNAFKLLSDLVVLVLTGDKSMEYLYQDGQGVVYKECLSWLKCSDENLQIAGALAAGNFARKDNHCIQMVKDDVAKDLLCLLLRHCSQDGDIRMQHAVLCAFRNLSIPVQNKSFLVQLGLVETLVSMMNIETFPVVFKLLATVRMIVDTQEKVACDIGVDKCFIQRLVYWCGTDDHPGVKGESTRLLAWLVKNSKSSKVMKNLLSCDALPPIISMLQSEYAVMQSEAVVAITLIASCCLEDLDGKLDLNELENCLVPALKSTPEVTENALVLILQLIKSDKIRNALNTPSFLAVLRTIKDGSNEKIQDATRNILLQLEH